MRKRLLDNSFRFGLWCCYFVTFWWTTISYIVFIFLLLVWLHANRTFLSMTDILPSFSSDFCMFTVYSVCRVCFVSHYVGCDLWCLCYIKWVDDLVFITVKTEHAIRLFISFPPNLHISSFLSCIQCNQETACYLTEKRICICYGGQWLEGKTMVNNIHKTLWQNANS